MVLKVLSQKLIIIIIKEKKKKGSFTNQLIFKYLWGLASVKLSGSRS